MKMMRGFGWLLALVALQGWAQGPLSVQVGSERLLPAWRQVEDFGSVSCFFMQPPLGCQALIRQGEDHFLAISADKRGGELFDLRGGMAVCNSDLLWGPGIKAAVPAKEGGWLVAVDNAPGANKHIGIFELQRNGKFRRLDMSQSYDGLGDIIASDDSYLFCDFERNNVWQFEGEGIVETALITNAPPKGLFQLALDDKGGIYALNHASGRWPFEGDHAVYKLVDGEAELLAKAPGMIQGMDWSPGGAFPEGLYVSLPQEGRILRMNKDGSWIDVLNGLYRPGRLTFDAGGNLYVVADHRAVMYFGRKALSKIWSPFEFGKTVIKLGAVHRARVIWGAFEAVSDAQGIALFNERAAAGDTLNISRAGYAPLQQELDPGAMEAKLWLRERSFLNVDGLVVLKGSDLPVAGAMLLFERTDQDTAMPGTPRASTGFDGTFKLFHVESGSYRVTIDAAGCEPFEQILEVDSNRTKLHFALEPKSELLPPINIVLRDRVSGAPVKAAQLTVAEAGLHAVIAEGKTDARGRATFKDLQQGILNWMVSNRVERINRSLTVLAEAEGYESTVFPLEMNKKASELKLNPIRTVKEQEPNDSLTAPQPLLPGTTVEVSVSDAKNEDVFVIELDHPASLKARIAKSESTQTHLTFFDGEGKKIVERGQYPNRENVLATSILPAGKYYLVFGEWGRNGTSEEVLKLELTRELAVDTLEPNNTRDAARLVQVGSELRGLISPKGDQDWFRFRVERPGQVRFLISGDHKYQREVLFEDGKGNKIASGGNYPGRPVEVSGWVQPGTYYLRVTEWSSNEEFIEAWSGRLEYIPDDGRELVDLKAVPLKAEEEIILPCRLNANIFPLGDQDRYEVNLPSAGRLHFRGIAPKQLHVAVLDSQGKELAGAGQYGDRWLQGYAELSGPTNVFIQVSEWANNDAYSSPYTVLLDWERPDGRDQATRNDSMKTASLQRDNSSFSGSILPIKDQDWFRFDIEHPGVLTIKGKAPTQITATVLDGDGNKLGENSQYPGRQVSFESEVQPPAAYLRLTEWGNNDASMEYYHFSASLQRAEPGETLPLNESAARLLTIGEARAYRIDQVGDVDRFTLEAPANHKLLLYSVAPCETEISVVDANDGSKVGQQAQYPFRSLRFPLASELARSYEITVREWGNNGRSDSSGFIIVAEQETAIPAATLLAETSLDGQISLSREPREHFAEVVLMELDLDGDGRFDVVVPPGGEVSKCSPEMGLLAAAVRMTSADGTVATEQLWIDARTPQRREGVQMNMDWPPNGALIEEERAFMVHAESFSRAKVERVEFALDGKTFASSYSPPYEAEPNWLDLKAGDHKLQVTAYDSRGNSNALERSFALSPYFGLLPVDGAELSGESVNISWSGSGFGEAAVEYRQVDENEWRKAEGESGRRRSVLLSGLEPGSSYVFRALGADQPSAERRFKLVKGLAFGRSSYGANLRRDYNQRMGISVRNNGDEELIVNLECGKPDDPLLLVGFVGEGSEDKPFPLKPGAEREFMLGISAQDVLTSEHTFPVRITSNNGLSDEATVRLHVRLPVTKLEWQPIGAADYGLGQRFKLINKGDTVTDLAVRSKDSSVTLSPSFSHALLPTGKSVVISAYPRLKAGFKGMKTTLSARALGKDFSQELDISLPAGETLHQVYLMPGMKDGETAPIDMNAVIKKYWGSIDEVSPDQIDWSWKYDQDDTNGDGKPDRWYVFDDLSYTLWIGDDTDYDGQVDFAHADLGGDGIFEYSAIKKDRGWERTTLVEAWLEMGFTLPWARNAYKAHDADIVMNGVVIGSLRDTIPDGNYVFRIPPSVLKFDPKTGLPGDNKLGIHSKHLRGGHYIVNSDFRIQMRLTATPVWMSGKTETDAQAQALKMEGLNLSAPDYSVSSSEMKLDAPDELEKGMDVLVEVPIRNLGATQPAEVDVVLFSKNLRGEQRELSRIKAGPVPLSGSHVVRLPWKTTGGIQRLQLVVDPDKSSGDPVRINNEAILAVTIPGDDLAPAVDILSASVKGNLLDLNIRAVDEAGLANVEACIDGGLWQSLQGEKIYKAKGLLQPGRHIIRARAEDISGNISETSVDVSVSPQKEPQVRVVFPPQNKELLARSTKVLVRCSSDILLVAARTAGMPWRRAAMKGPVAQTTIPLRFGQQVVEVMAVNRKGIITTREIDVVCKRQPHPAQATSVQTAEEQSGTATLQGFGPVDFFQSGNFLIQPHLLKGAE